MATIGEKINYLRKKTGDSQKELAQKIDISRVSAGNYERGDRTPPTEVLNKLADYFKVSIKFFLNDKIELSEFESYRIRSLAEFVHSLDEEQNAPLKTNEFFCLYRDDSDNEISYRDFANNEIDFFDLNRIIQNEYRKNVKNPSGISSIGNTPLYYCKKELTSEDRIQILKVLDAIFGIDRIN